MRTMVFYAETILGTTEMRFLVEGYGKCLTACSRADNSWGQEHTTWEMKEKVKKGKT